MKSLRYYSAMTISGFLFLIGVFEIIVNYYFYYQNEFDLVFKYEKFLPYLTVVILVISYLTGTLLNLISVWIWEKISLIKNKIKDTWYKRKGKEVPKDKPKDSKDLDEFILRQFGTERLNQEIDLRYNYLLTLRLICFSFPFFSLGLYVRLNSMNQVGSTYVLYICSFLEIFFVIAYIRRTSMQFKSFRRVTLDELKKQSKFPI